MASSSWRPLQIAKKSLYLSMLCAGLLTYTPVWAQDADVLMVQGRAELRQAASEPWRPLAAKQSLAAGSTVRTLPDSQMALLLRDQTQLRLNQNTTVQIQSLQVGGDQGTTLALSEGRLWAQVKQFSTAALRTLSTQAQPQRLRIVTPTATVGIRGTNWELAVGEQGTTRLTVLSGEVEMSNELGRVSVGANEQAIAEQGKAPVKSLLSDAQDRVQWVTTYRPSPSRWLAQPPAALQAAASDIEAGRYTPALTRLQALPPTRERALLLADLGIYLGNAAEAAAVLTPFSQNGRGDAFAAALHGRALLVAGRLEEASTLLQTALQTHPSHPEVLLALADVLRVAGEADMALGWFSQVTRAQPDRHEGWFGVGRIQLDKDNVKPARQALDEAIRLAPNEPGYAGERATLLVLAGQLQAARQAFDEALARQSDDYLAWTGLGILQLKMGQAPQALESFLKAGVIEPRFARAQLYAGITYYQLGDATRALEAVNQATQLDSKDPLPYLMLALIHGDTQNLAAATQAAQQAQLRMPYLKSANQLLNNQKGSANVGSALANRGLEEWARSYAADSYSPYWAGSAFFLADRYTDGFNKNSELFRGFLLDPLSFGASNRFSSLVPVPGHYASIGLGRELADLNLSAVQATANGLFMSDTPVAYSLIGQKASAASRNGQINDGRFGNLSLGLGMKPRHDVGLFYFGSRLSFDALLKQPVVDNITTFTAGPVGVTNTRHDIGLSWQLAAENQVLFKLGQGQQKSRVNGDIGSPEFAGLLNLLFFEEPRVLPFSSLAPTQYSTGIRERDIQLNHSFTPKPTLRLAWGYETAKERQDVNALISFQSEPVPALAVRLRQQADRDVKYKSWYVSSRGKPSDAIEWQADLMYQRLQGQSLISTRLDIPDVGDLTDESATTPEKVSGFNPRLGLRFSPAAGQQMRLVYQRWRRPLGITSLAPADTLSIPVEDRLVSAGGLQNKLRAQYDWQLSERSFLQWFAQHRRVSNLVNPLTSISQAFDLTDLDSLRPRKQIFGLAFNELEDTPAFSEGRVSSTGIAGNWILSRAWTLTTRYTYARSRNTSSDAAGLKVPYIPRHLVNASVYWQASPQWILATSATFRSSRFLDELNSARLAAGWNIGLTSYWESQDKRWSVEAALLNIQTHKQAAIASRAAFSLTGIYRF
jgi:tetratricopeptide (TPR) repeat protein